MVRLAAVLGRDVSRSLSPRLHNAAAHALGLPVSYVPVSCPDAAAFTDALAALDTLGAVGANVTIPYKQAALQACAQVSNIAQEIGAVNTLSFARGGRLQGDNTDGPGLAFAFEALPEAAFERVQILGAGGAARAAAWALARRGAADVHVTARRNADAVAALARGKAHTLELVRGVTMVVSTLPKDGDLARQALAQWVDLERRPLVYDLAYGDAEDPTPLVSAARARGLDTIDGLRMLVEQAALSLSLWTGGELSRIRSVMGAVAGLSEAGDESPGV